MLLGIHLTLLIGPTLAVPAPPSLAESIQRVEVTHTDEGHSGFQITFHVGRGGLADLLDYSLVSNPLLRPFNRVILIVRFNLTPRVLIDGVITNSQLSPSDEPGASSLTITGEDIGLLMDMEEKSAEHPAQNEMVIANKIILSYGLIPNVTPPPTVDYPIPIERIPVQQGTDFEYLQELAARFGYVFYVTPGPSPFINVGYWGPPKRVDIPQSALSVNMGPQTNVDSINFQNNSLAPTMVEGSVQDRLTDEVFPVQTFLSSRPPLASQPAWLVNQPNVRRKQFRECGVSVVQAFALAQGITDEATDVVTADGELGASRYGTLLQPRGLVGLRGAGYSYDGLYYVKRVTHVITMGQYKQRFTLTREGVGSITPVVMP